MNFTRMNKEDVIRKYISGALSSEEHIEVSDLIQTNPEWRLAMERHTRSHQRHAAEYVGTASTNQASRETSTTPRPENQPKPQSNRPAPNAPATETWLTKFIKGYGIWIAVFLFFRFGSSIIGWLKDLRSQLPIGDKKEVPIIENKIAKDLEARFGKPDDEKAHLIATCTETLAKAEKHYQDGRVQRYVDELLSVGLDEQAPCRDEALYLAAEASVDQGDIDLALNLISQMSDLDHYNADMQWLIAKAMVHKAKVGSTPADKAKRAVDRAMAFPENEKYKTEAEELLSSLGSDI
jgi:hypothetical protein